MTMLTIFLLINVFMLDLVIFGKFFQPSIPLIPKGITNVVSQPSCSNCQNKIQTLTNIVGSLQKSFDAKPWIATVTPTLTMPPIQQQVSQAKDLYVPLGTGVNQTDAWQNISGAQAYIDSASYGQIKQVVFEVGGHTPTGNETVYVRLYNTTAMHPVWFSDVSWDGGSPVFLTSQPIRLDPGNNLYTVQMETSLKYQANLDQARVHITLY